MDETTDPDSAARALHAADRTLNWLRWEQLKEATRDEYRRAANAAGETE